MVRDEQNGWDGAWSEATVEAEIGTLSYPWVQPFLRFIKRHLVPGLPVLEAGCGPGRFLHWLRERGPAVVGVDWSLTALQKAKAYSPAFQIAQADVRRLPFADGLFGTCLSFGVIEHFPEGPDECLLEMRRVLRPDGVLVLGVPQVNLLAMIDPPLKAAYRRLRCMSAPAGSAEPPGRYERLGEVTAALTRAGYEILEILPFGHAYSLHSLCGLFRRRGAYHDVTRLAAWLGRLMAQVVPWSTASTLLIAARAPLDHEAIDAARD